LPPGPADDVRSSVQNGPRGYAQSHKFPEVTAGLSLLCSLPANVIERGLIDTTGETPMIFAKALDFSWETTMSLLFLSAPDYKISACDLDALKAKSSHD
jgi:hypothetical protein